MFPVNDIKYTQDPQIVSQILNKWTEIDTILTVHELATTKNRINLRCVPNMQINNNSCQPYGRWIKRWVHSAGC